MNKTLITIIVALLLVAGCGESQLAVSALSSSNNDLTTLFGVRDGNIGAGFVGKFVAADNVEWNELTPDEVGLYVELYATQDASITDTGDPSPIGPWLEAMHAQPYVRLEGLGPLRGSRRSVRTNYAVGTRFTMTEDGNIGVNVEYNDGESPRTRGFYIGGSWQF